MINNYHDKNTDYVMGKIAYSTDDELLDFIYGSCKDGNLSFVQNISHSIGLLKFQFLIERNSKILEEIIVQKHFEVLRVIFLDTKLPKDYLTNIYLHSNPPIEVVNILNWLDYRNNFIKTSRNKNKRELESLINSKLFEDYPNKKTLLENLFVDLFLGDKEDVDYFKFIIDIEKLKSFSSDLIYFSLYYSLFSHKINILKYIVFDLNIKRTSSIELLASSDKDGILKKMLDMRDLNEFLNLNLSEEEKSSGRTKI